MNPPQPAPPVLPDLAHPQQGLAPRALSVGEAQALLGQWCGQRAHELLKREGATENVALEKSFGRTLCQDIFSPMDVPAHTNSAMDGYAYRWEEMAPNESRRTLKVVHTVLAGQAWGGQVGRDECVKIMTGGVMPGGCDTVAPLERVREMGADSGLVQIELEARLFQAGDNQRLKGEDLQAGGLALAQGTTLHAAAMGLLASLGLSHVRVWRALKVAIFSTGSEVLALGAPFKSGHVYDANRLSLTGLLQGLGLEIVDLGVVRDDPQALKETFIKAQNLADVVITSGGVSMGEADHTKDTLKALGEVVFWHIAMRPGRPFALGQIGQCMLFALPGNPVAMIVTFLALVRPALLQLSGKTPEEPAFLWAQSGEHLRKKPGRTEYQRGQTHVNETGELCVRLTGNQGSGILSSLVQGDCLIVLGHDQGDVEPGDSVKIWPLKGLI
jgi:molybdopterin molybdotransferase